MATRYPAGSLHVYIHRVKKILDENSEVKKPLETEIKHFFDAPDGYPEKLVIFERIIEKSKTLCMRWHSLGPK